MEKIRKNSKQSLSLKCQKKIFSWHRKGSRFTDGGATNYINAIMFLMVFVFNLSDQIIKGQNIIERWPYTVLFLLFAILTVIFRHKAVSAFLYASIGFFICLDPSNITDFSGAIFFIFSFHIIKKVWFAGIIGAFNGIAIYIRLAVINDSIHNALIMVLVFAYIYAIYYFLIFKETGFSKKSPLSQEQTDLMRMVSEQGLTQKEIAVKLSISQDKVFSKIKEIRELLTPEGDSTITKEQAIYIIVSKYGISDGKIL